MDEKVIRAFADAIKHTNSIEKELGKISEDIYYGTTVIEVDSDVFKIRMKYARGNYAYNLETPSSFKEALAAIKLTAEEKEEIMKVLFKNIAQATERYYKEAKEAHTKEIIK